MRQFSLVIIILFASTSFAIKDIKHPDDYTSRTNDNNISFTENKGQVSDQNYKPRPDILFGGTTNGMTFHLRNNGISYQLNRIDSWKEEKDLKTKQKRKVSDQTGNSAVTAPTSSLETAPT